MASIVRIAVLCALALPVSATSMALIMTDQEIVVAIDSRATDGNGHRLPDICKIRRAGAYFFSITGFSGRQASLFQSFQRAIAKPGSLTDNLYMEASALAPILEAELRGTPAAQEYAIENGKLTDVIVYGIQDNRPFVKYLVFTVDGQKVKPDLKQCPGTNCPRSGPVVVTAPVAELDARIDPLAATRSYVEQQVAKGVPEIGGPMQVLRLMPNNGPTWIEKPNVCSGQ
jgi:hypothetical protein